MEKTLLKVLCVSLGMVIVSSMTFPPSRRETTPKPNIPVILTDDPGYHDVLHYETKDIRTPHMDQLAKDGMRFDNYYSNCPVCSPIRAALLTGRYFDGGVLPSGTVDGFQHDSVGSRGRKSKLPAHRLLRK